MKKFLVLVSVLLLSAVTMFAQENDEWYWNKPITKIDFEGLNNVRKNDLNGIVSYYINEPFTEQTYNDLLDRLYALDYFDEIIPFAKSGSKNNDSVYLVFEVVERPTIKSIVFNGNNKVRNGELREEIKTKVSDVYVEGKVLVDERAIRNYYLGKGYTTSSVSHEIKEEEGGVVLIFNISEGETTVISSIQFVGNTIVTARALKSKLSLKEVGFLKDGAFQNSNLEQDKITIINYYRERGYVDANIIDVKMDTQLNEAKQRNELTITFVLQEGARYIFTGLDITGNEVFEKSELLALNKLKPGSVYNELKFQESISAIEGKYYENGNMTNEFAIMPVKDSERHEIAFVLNIKEHERSHIENIIIKGNNKTKDFVIRREIPIESGDVFSRDKIINAMRNLMNLQYFSNVIPEPQMGSEENLVDIAFTVEEQSTTSLQFGVTFSGITEPTDIPISLYLKMENSNLFGEGKSLSASLSVSTTEQAFDLTYAQGWIGNLPISYSQSLSFSHARNTEQVNMFLPNLSLNQQYFYMQYESWTASLGTAFGRRWYYDYAIFALTAGLTNSLTNYIYDEALYVPVDLSASMYANRWGWLNSVYTQVSLDNRDIAWDPSKGWFVSEKLAWYGLIPYLEREFFLRSDTKLEGYLKLIDLPVTEKWNLKLVLADYTGFTGLFPVNSSITDSNRVFIDGLFNGRGWSMAYKTSRGLAMLSNRLELRMPIVPGLVGIDFFWDAAAVKSSVNDMATLGLQDFYFSFGPAIRVLMQQLPLHLMFAFKYRYNEDSNKFKFDNSPFQFVLSFNLVNR